MPHCNDPDCLRVETIEEPVWHHDQFSIWQIGKFRQVATGFGIPGQPSQKSFSLPAKAQSRGVVISANVGDSGKKLNAG